MTDLKQRLNEGTSLWQRLRNCRKPIALYGMGDGAEKVIHYLNMFGKRPDAVFASDDFVRGQSFLGYKVRKYAELAAEFGEFIVLVSFGTQRQEVIDNILRVADEQETYAPNVPLFGEGLFDYDYFLRYESELNRVYNNLADEKSREVFALLCDYNISGKISYLMAATTEKSEADNLLALGTDEVYLDLGAYNGDTVLEFAEAVSGGYRQVLAVEPDGKNFAKLQNNTAHLQDITYLNYGIWQDRAELFFSSKAGRNSALATSGNRSVQCLSIDEIQREYAAAPISLIKMDVEGVEKQALTGGVETLGNHRPKLAVSAYHRNEDLFVLPLLIWQQNSGYEIYLRHHLYIPGWENNYYCL